METNHEQLSTLQEESEEDSMKCRVWSLNLNDIVSYLDTLAVIDFLEYFDPVYTIYSYESRENMGLYYEVQDYLEKGLFSKKTIIPSLDSYSLLGNMIESTIDILTFGQWIKSNIIFIKAMENIIFSKEQEIIFGKKAKFKLQGIVVIKSSEELETTKPDSPDKFEVYTTMLPHGRTPPITLRTVENKQEYTLEKLNSISPELMKAIRTYGIWNETKNINFTISKGNILAFNSKGQKLYYDIQTDMVTIDKFIEPWPEIIIQEMRQKEFIKKRIRWNLLMQICKRSQVRD